MLQLNKSDFFGAVLALVLAGAMSLASPVIAQQRPAPPPRPPGPAGRQPPPPPGFDRDRVADQINRTRHFLAEVHPVSVAEKEIFSQASACLKHAQEQLAANQIFAASRLAGAADALAHALGSLQHRSGAPGPPPPPPGPPPLPPGQDLSEYLVQVYFRIRQADYFLQQSHDSGAKSLPGLARRFYQQARQAFDKGRAAEAEEYAGAAEDIVRALEFLAQAAVRIPPTPPGAPTR